MTKVCPGCSVEQPLDADHFHRNPARSSGWERRCKACISAYKRQWRLQPREWMAYRDAAEHFGVTYRTLVAAVARGQLVLHRRDGQRVLNRTEVSNYLAQRDPSRLLRMQKVR